MQFKIWKRKPLEHKVNRHIREPELPTHTQKQETLSMTWCGSINSICLMLKYWTNMFWQLNDNACRSGLPPPLHQSPNQPIEGHTKLHWPSECEGLLLVSSSQHQMDQNNKWLGSYDHMEGAADVQSNVACILLYGYWQVAAGSIYGVLSWCHGLTSVLVWWSLGI